MARLPQLVRLGDDLGLEAIVDDDEDGGGDQGDDDEGQHQAQAAAFLLLLGVAHWSSFREISTTCRTHSSW
jgi:hypothetical protein